ncbi:hypothetical protein [Actinokineospora inagensis]|uniref:hypothetical protein n=1 Tax=Actinokineospora inagensis TaxID=103730 RepID=UPI0003FA17B4|nr:hypothetical protein [Actinokineospora inagensis]
MPTTAHEPAHELAPAAAPVVGFRTIGTTHDRWGRVPLIRLSGPGAPPQVLTGPELATALTLARTRLLGTATPTQIATDAWTALTDTGVEALRALTDTTPDPVVHAVRTGHPERLYALTRDHNARRCHALAALLADAGTGPVDLDHP